MINLSIIQRPLVFLMLLLLSFSAAAYNPYSTRELDELQQEFIQLINQSPKIIRNPLANQYINYIGNQLTHTAHFTHPYFFIIQSKEINAFAGPGGYIGLNTQLILATDNESELAAVMAHELAHVRLHHLYRMIGHQQQMRMPMLASLLASAALGAINPTLGSGALMAAMSGFTQDSINFTRANEKEADRIGISMLIRAGFDPHGMIEFFKKMQQTSRLYYTANIPSILRSHPLDEERIAEAENRLPAKKKEPYQNNADYYLFKELIRNETSQNPKEILDYYQRSCAKHNTAAACQYGYAVALINYNQFNQAATYLTPLLADDKNNLFYQLAMAQVETGNQQFTAAITRLQDLQTAQPTNYAILTAEAQTLLAAREPHKAESSLLKASRLYKKDLLLCELLAQAQAAGKRKSYAYFTKGQCELLQGRNKEALHYFQLVKSLAKQDHYLLARTNANIADLKNITRIN